ncbi:uncharacterized protein EMH_0039940 [Eimeria mitis]|uniref:Uncharacterized protein n=1 Tax=Eimeria mitis TaxID=44415 RepID=U6KI23_9EIME|nr:uncharacterized protein EMH_0039940 [Eimeria mitis]CDJ35887.1 hypothetical protein, conserved [Eimeria mitis]
MGPSRGPRLTSVGLVAVAAAAAEAAAGAVFPFTSASSRTAPRKTPAATRAARPTAATAHSFGIATTFQRRSSSKSSIAANERSNRSCRRHTINCAYVSSTSDNLDAELVATPTTAAESAPAAKTAPAVAAAAAATASEEDTSVLERLVANCRREVNLFMDGLRHLELEAHFESPTNARGPNPPGSLVELRQQLRVLSAEVDAAERRLFVANGLGVNLLQGGPSARVHWGVKGRWLKAASSWR